MIKLKEILEIKSVDPTNAKIHAFDYFKEKNLYLLSTIIDGINNNISFNKLPEWYAGWKSWEEFLGQDYGWDKEDINSAMPIIKHLYLFKPNETVVEILAENEDFKKKDISQYKFLDVKGTEDDNFIILTNF